MLGYLENLQHLILDYNNIEIRNLYQDSVALSTSESEYMVSSLCGQEIVYIRVILRDFVLSQSQPTLVYGRVHCYVYQSCVSQVFASHPYSETLPS